MNKKGTWPQALGTFLLPILLVMGVRWALLEPFVIPSGSMIPNLLIHDHIFVKKFSLGLHWPFSDHWMFFWRQPERGEITVFKYPQNPDVYYIKRLIGLPGDEVEVTAGRIRVNGVAWNLSAVHPGDAELGFDYFEEKAPGVRSHRVRFLADRDENTAVEVFKVPAGQYFFMGDNRDQSSDSRYWGFVKKDLLVGPAWMIWLSCDNTLPSLSYVCDPSQIRWSRLATPFLR